MDVPESMIERQYSAMRKEQDGRLQRDIGQSLSEYLKNNNLSVDEYDAKLRKNAEEIVRNTLVLDSLADRDEISFTNEELSEEIMRMAAGLNVNAQSLADSLSKDKEKFADVARKVRTRNTMNHLASLVQAREVDPPASSAENEEAPEASAAGDVPAAADEAPAEGGEGAE